MYEKIFKDTMLKYQDKTLGENSLGRNDWIYFYVCLLYPKMNINEMIALAKKEFGVCLDKDSFSEFVLKRKLQGEDLLKKIKVCKDFSKKFFCLIKDGDEKCFKEIAHFCKRDSRFKGHYTKMILLWVFDFCPTIDLGEKRFLFRELSYKNSLAFLLDFISNISNKYGYTVDKFGNLKREYGDTKNLFAIDNTSSYTDALNKDKQIEALLFDIRNYKSALENAEKTFEDLKKDFANEVLDAQDRAITDFFINLNSQNYGNILDNLLVVDKKLKDMRKNGEKIPSNFMPLSIILSQIIKFIKDSNIQPIKNTNKAFIGSWLDVENYTYFGEPFKDDKEKKKLEFVSPGWKYKDIIISIPVVREIID